MDLSTHLSPHYQFLRATGAPGHQPTQYVARKYPNGIYNGHYQYGKHTYAEQQYGSRCHSRSMDTPPKCSDGTKASHDFKAQYAWKYHNNEAALYYKREHSGWNYSPYTRQSQDKFHQSSLSQGCNGVTSKATATSYCTTKTSPPPLLPITDFAPEAHQGPVLNHHQSHPPWQPSSSRQSPIEEFHQQFPSHQQQPAYAQYQSPKVMDHTVSQLNHHKLRHIRSSRKSDALAPSPTPLPTYLLNFFTSVADLSRFYNSFINNMSLPISEISIPFGDGILLCIKCDELDKTLPTGCLTSNICHLYTQVHPFLPLLFHSPKYAKLVHFFCDWYAEEASKLSTYKEEPMEQIKIRRLSFMRRVLLELDLYRLNAEQEEIKSGENTKNGNWQNDSSNGKKKIQTNGKGSLHEPKPIPSVIIHSNGHVNEKLNHSPVQQPLPHSYHKRAPKQCDVSKAHEAQIQVPFVQNGRSTIGNARSSQDRYTKCSISSNHRVSNHSINKTPVYPVPSAQEIQSLHPKIRAKINQANRYSKRKLTVENGPVLKKAKNDDDVLVSGDGVGAEDVLLSMPTAEDLLNDRTENIPADSVEQPGGSNPAETLKSLENNSKKSQGRSSKQENQHINKVTVNILDEAGEKEVKELVAAIGVLPETARIMVLQRRIKRGVRKLKQKEEAGANGGVSPTGALT